jgi:RNA polymerase sigma-70 factor (ECF subfamily)
VEHYQRPVYSLAFRMLGNGHDAEDAAQEAFVRAYRSLGAYDPARPFGTWLLSITAHHCIDRLRRRRMTEVSLDELPPWRPVVAEADDPARGVERTERAERIQRLLAALPEDYRLVIVLRYWHELGYAEIARMIDDTESAVKSRLHRARRQLAELLAQEDAREVAEVAVRPGRPATAAVAPAAPQEVKEHAL